MTNTSDKNKPTHVSREIAQTLGKLGLSENEQAVYLEVLRHDESSPYQLAKATGVPRTTVYDVVSNLALRGLITATQSDGLQKQQTKIKPINPSILRTSIQQQRQELNALEVDVVDILPFLKEEFHQEHTDARCRFYPGIAGARQVYLAPPVGDAPIVTWDNLMPMDAFGNLETNIVSDQETAAALEPGRHVRELIPLTTWGKHVLSYQQERNPAYARARQIRYIENPLYEARVRISIQGKKIWIVSAHESDIWGLELLSESLAGTLKSLFEVLWLTAKPVTPEMITSWGPNEFLQFETTKRRR